jgi:DNA-directed RNA polymerase specialized sigma24 family protein
VIAMLSDEALAVRAARGDNAAFGELARRYEPLLHKEARRVPEGQDRDDARQEALIGLYEACRATDGKRPFAGSRRSTCAGASRWRAATRPRSSAGC